MEDKPIEITFPEPTEIRETFIHTAEAEEPLPLREVAYWKAVNAGVSWKKLDNLIYSESKWDVNILDSPQGDRGIAQINRRWHPEVSDECAYNPECALDWTIQRIIDGYDYEWVPCNCYAYASLFMKLPKMAQIKPNSIPVVGSIVIMNYRGVKHVSVITGLSKDGVMVKEANFTPCLVGKRFISFKDPFLVGFFNPALNM